MKYDVVIWDSVGMPYNLWTKTGVGGSEHAVIRLGRALEATGLTVQLLEPSSKFDNISAKNLIIIRNSNIPDIPHDKLIIWAHDSHSATFPEEESTTVFLSHWQKGNFSPRKSVVIPNMLPNVVYNSDRPPREFGRYLYASAAIKGWPETYEVWKEIRTPGDTLRVLASGYDKADRYDDPTLVFLDPLDDYNLVYEIARAEGLLAVNVWPEVWPSTLAMADALGTPVYVFAEKGRGGSPEVLTQCGVTSDRDIFRSFKPRDFRIKTILPMWLDLLS